MKGQKKIKDPEEPRKKKPEVVITVPKNFDRTKYKIPQMRIEEIENEEVETLSRSKQKDTERPLDNKVPQDRPFDRLSPIERVYQPKDSSLPKKTNDSDEVSSSKERLILNRSEDIRRALKPKENLSDKDWKSVKQKAVEEIAERILRNEVEISAEDAVKASPELQKTLLRKIRNRRIPR